MQKKYPYLKDTSFLNKIYDQHNKVLYSQVTSLDWQERRLQDIQGRVISGSISINGDSSSRRTANLSIKILNSDELYDNIDSLFSINKKVYLEIGLKNNYAHLGQYADYPIIWFPLGVYIIVNYSLNRDNTGVTISLSLNDKMSLLNGYAGGTIPAATNFESYDTLGPDGDIHTEPIRINQIIPEMVNHFGGEDLNKIIVNDIDDKIKQVLKWRGTNALYLYENLDNFRNVFYTTMTSNPPAGNWNCKKIINNYDAGYTYTDFIYPGELTGNAGDSVCTILDKIKTTLGNYEYYYDVFGNFIFQEIKNYVNVSEWRTTFQQKLSSNDDYLPYAYNTRLNTAVYDFSANNFVVSYSNAPQFNMIKNDFVVWGVRKSTSGSEFACRYHLAIDDRPKLLEDYIIPISICFDTSMNDKIRRCFPIERGTYTSPTELPTQGIVGKYYYVNSSDEAVRGVYTWVKDIEEYNNLLQNYLESGSGNELPVQDVSTKEKLTTTAGYLRMPLATYYAANTFVVPVETNWRNILYFQDMYAASQGLQTSYYWAEMYNEWPKLYDIEHNDWIEGVLDMPSSLDWWLDIIDNDANINEFSVSNIGRRSYSTKDDSCNCVFEPDIPDIIIINTSENSGDVADTRSQMTGLQLKELGLIPTQVSDAVYNSLTVGGSFNSCYQHVRQLLTNYTNYNENITVTCLPIYHLEPNTRVFFNDPESGIYGDYIINTISFDLGGGSMNINAKKCIEKI